VILLNQAEERHEDICSSLELFAAEVLPSPRPGAEHQAWKQSVARRDIELEELDTEPHNVRTYQSVSKEPAPT
jgi:hypothetical protein